MIESTLGLIETYGFIGAVEALDTALKTADVKFISCEFIKGGIVTVIITGSVASVKVAIEASSIAADKLGALLNAHVIARAGEGVWDMLKDYKEPCEKSEKPMGSKNVGNYNVVKDEKNKNEVSAEEEKAEEVIAKEAEEAKTEEEAEATEAAEAEVVEKAAAEKTEEAEETEESAEPTNEVFFRAENLTYTTREKLEKFKVTELRTIARACENISLTKEQIKFSKKEQLIEAILTDAGRRDD